MAWIVYQTNHKTGTGYAYRSESYRGLITKQRRPHRTCLAERSRDPFDCAKGWKRNRSSLGEENKTEKEAAKRIEQKLNADMAEMRSIIKEYRKKVSQINRISEM